MKVLRPSLLGQFLCALVLLLAAPLHAQGSPWWNRSIWSNPDRGNVWYPPEKAPEREEEEAKAPEVTQERKAPEIEEFERVQKRLDELRRISIMNPSEENLRAYIQAQEEHMQRASVFADQWQRTLWANPELKYAGRPTNATGITGFDTNYSQQVRTSLAKLAPTHGLYFFFRSDCPFCHSMAPTLKQLEQIHGIKVVAISLDGGPIPHFPNAITDKGQAQALGVRSVPSFFLASPQQQTVYPLGTGVLSLSTIEDRIFTQAFTQPGSKF